MGKKILYIYGGLYAANGMSAIISQKVNYLAEHTENKIYIILTEHPEKPQFYKLSPKVHCKQLTINFDDLDIMPFYKKIIHYFIKLRKAKSLFTKYMMELKPDITVSITRREINFINQINDGSKKISEIHFARTYYRKFNNPFLPESINKLISKIWIHSLIGNLKQLERFVVLTKEDYYNWPELNNVIVIPNFIFTIPTNKSKCNTKRIIAVGRYCYQKGYDILINVWTEVIKCHPDWILDIFGSGDSLQYQKLANEKGLKDSLHCNNAVSNIFDEYAQSSLFVLSSRYEGFGLVILEAMGAGLPVVAFKCPCGPKDMITDGVNGFLIENGNVSQMAKKICFLIENEELRKQMGHNAIETIYSYQKENVMKKWIDLFNSL